jgi:hypothetical protein
MMNLPALAQAPGFSPDSRVWVYVADRRLNEAESKLVQDRISQFTKQWTAHNAALQAAAEVFDRHAIILMVDETKAGASGCSIDKSVHFLEALGQDLGVDFFDRMRFGWVDDLGVMHWSRMPDFAKMVGENRISPDTPVLNTLAQTKKDLEERWQVPFMSSWQKRLV